MQCFELNFSVSPPKPRSDYKFHGGSKQSLMCVVINNSHYLAFKTNNPAYHAFGKYWMQAKGLLNYRLKFCWLKVICCIWQPNELERKINHKTGGDCQISGGRWPTQAPRPLLEPLLILSYLRVSMTNNMTGCVIQLWWE